MVNDISIAAIIFSILLLVGVTVPLVQSAFDSPVSSSLDTQGLEDELTANTQNPDAPSVLGSVLRSVFYVAPFGMLWLDLPLLILKAILILIIARNLWPFGSGG